MTIPAFSAAFLADPASTVRVVVAFVEDLKIPEIIGKNALTDIANAYNALAHKKTNVEKTVQVLNERQEENHNSTPNGYTTNILASRTIPNNPENGSKGRG